MEAQNGLYVAIKGDTGARSVFIDEEMLEMQRMNRLSEGNRQRLRDAAKRQAKEAQAKREYEEHLRRRAAEAEQAQREETRGMLLQELKLVGSAVGVVILDALKAIAPALTIVALVGILGGICYVAGRWMGRRKVRR